MSTLTFASFAVLLLASSFSLPRAQKSPDVRVGFAPPGASSFGQQIAAVGSAVYVCWQDTRNGKDDIYFNRSLDGGATWLPAEVRIDVGDPPGMAQSSLPQIAASEGAVYVVWQDDRNSPTRVSRYDVYFNRSLDGGATWLPADVRLDIGSAAGAASSTAPVIATSGSSVYVCWTDVRSSQAHVYLNRSTDAGTTWLATDVRVDSSPAGASGPQIALSGSTLHVVWTDIRSGNRDSDIYSNRSLDGGVTWLASDARVDRAPGGVSSFGPKIAVSGASVYVTWGDWRSGVSFFDVYFNRSSDEGATWGATDVRLNRSADCLFPEIAASGPFVYVTWAFYNDEAYPVDVQFNRSLDAGSTWLAVPLRLDVGDALTTWSYNPHIVATGSAVYVSWRDYRDYGPDIYLNRSNDAGTSWLSSDVRLDTGTTAGSEYSYWPVLAASGSSVYVAWQDSRNTTSRLLTDIYFNLVLGFQPYGTGSAGTGGIVPTISGSGTASIGEAFSIDLARGRGGAPCTLIWGVNGPASISLDGGSLLVQLPVERRLVRLGGEEGAPGAGSTSVVFEVPNELAVIGARIDFQARVLDPGDDAGVALTGGLEVWIL